MTKQEVKVMVLEFVRCGGTVTEAWEATAYTLMERLNKAQGDVQELRDTSGALSCEVADMVHSRDAWKQLRDGFTGMGHNILTEKSGLWQSPSMWSRLKGRQEKLYAVLERLYNEELKGEV